MIVFASISFPVETSLTWIPLRPPSSAPVPSTVFPSTSFPVEADAIVAIVINRVLHDPHAGGLVNVDSVVAVSLNEILLQNDTRRLGHVDTVPRRHGERDRRDY